MGIKQQISKQNGNAFQEMEERPEDNFTRCVLCINQKKPKWVIPCEQHKWRNRGMFIYKKCSTDHKQLQQYDIKHLAE